MKLEIITPEQVYFSGEVASVTLPGKNGSFTVWENHAPIISSLAAGKISYKANNQDLELTVDGGFAEVNKNVVTVCLELI
ncbi:MAG: ATP synthase F1 subunit epsilon [Paludibacter sp.]|jgi:F-type H+-transporting ATPase subunit epsilon|nr:ATP synthase F1 subunit epsilon [Paludibacter sp.]